MLVSCILIAVGIVDTFLRPGTVAIPSTLSQVLTSGIGSPTVNVTALIEGAAKLNGLDIVQIGVVILLATPIIRVAVTSVIFAIEKDATYLVIGLFVLLVLLTSVFIVGPYEAATHV